MLNGPSDKTKRRPVDVLFGDEDAPTIPNYIVEAPRPPANIAPPPPEMITHTSDEESDEDSEDESASVPRATFPAPPPARAAPPPQVVAPSPAPVAVSTQEKSLPASTPAATSSQEDMQSENTPSAEVISSLQEDSRFITLSFQIERLYDEVKTHLRDSPKLTQECFDLLLQARQAYVRRDHAAAEFYIQSTDAKLKRSVESEEESRSLGTVLLWLWQLGTLALAGTLITTTYLSSLTVLGSAVMSEFVVLARALGWGMVGGVIGGLYNLTRYIHRREFDPAYNMHYFARPFVGALIGAMLFVLSQAGIIAGNIVVDDFKVGPIFLYVFALLAGFKQEFVGEFFDNLMKAVFRGPNKK